MGRGKEERGAADPTPLHPSPHLRARARARRGALALAAVEPQLAVRAAPRGGAVARAGGGGPLREILPARLRSGDPWGCEAA